MPIIDLTATPVPNDDENADAIDIAGPINAILAVLNGHLDGDNFEPGSLPWSVMDNFEDEIPAAAMEDEGNSVKFRDEANLGFVASGLVWSDVSGLDGSMTSGVVYTVDGKRHAVSSVATKAFTASKDTYVDILTNGSVSYDPVTNGDPAPALTAGAMRIAKVVTDGTEITSVLTSGFDSLLNPIRPTTFVGFANLPLMPSVLLRRTTSQNVSTSTDTNISYDTAEINVDGMWKASNPTYITIPVTGWYQLSAALRWDTNSTGARWMLFRQATGGKRYHAQTINAASAGSPMHEISAIYHFTQGENISVQVWQSSGGTRSINADDSDQSNYFAAMLLRQTA